jgi:DNA repair protein RadC
MRAAAVVVPGVPGPQSPALEGPRERLRAVGLDGLADAELLALVIGSGVPGHDASAIARGLLATGSLRELAQRDVRELRRGKGIGAVTASRLAAVFEIGRRCAGLAPARGEYVRHPGDLADYLIARFGDQRHECFGLALLDGRNRFLRTEVISRGGWSSSVVRPREVFRQCLLSAAPATILFHNHPSGDPTPSREDVAITRQLLSAGDLLGIRVLDHLVVAAEGYASLRDRGLM